MALLAFLKEPCVCIIAYTHNIKTCVYYFLVLCADTNTWFKKK